MFSEAFFRFLKYSLAFVRLRTFSPEANQISSSVISWSEGLSFNVMKSWNMLGKHAFKLFTIDKKTTELDYRDVLQICNLHVRFDFPVFFLRVKILELLWQHWRCLSPGFPSPPPPISTTGHTFIEIVYRVLCCRLNELFISELCKKTSHGHTLLFVLVPDDGLT